MSRRALAAIAMICATVLALPACGEQVPGGVPADGHGQEHEGHEESPMREHDLEQSREPVGSDAPQGGASDADDPIVVKIGEDEFLTNMAIYRRYDQAKGGPLALQAPVRPAESVAGGKRQDYVGGAIFWSPETGAQIVRGEILATYLEDGGPAGALGWPIGDETVEGEAITSDFQRGQIRLEDGAIRVVELDR